MRKKARLFTASLSRVTVAIEQGEGAVAREAPVACKDTRGVVR